MVQQIASSSQMLAEQGGGSFLAEWGGPAIYIQASQMPVAMRVTYYAVRAGYSTPDAISVVTGLPEKDVRSSIAALIARGLITDAEASPEG